MNEEVVTVHYYEEVVTVHYYVNIYRSYLFSFTVSTHFVRRVTSDDISFGTSYLHRIDNGQRESNGIL